MYEHENRNIAMETADIDEAQGMRYSPWACEHCLSMCLKGFDTLLENVKVLTHFYRECEHPVDGWHSFTSFDIQRMCFCS